MRRGPNEHESRIPAVVIYSATGLFAGLAAGIVLGTLFLLVLVGAVLGLLYGLFATRTKDTPADD